MSTFDNQACIYAPRHRLHEDDHLLLLDDVLMVLDCHNQGIPSLDSWSMLIRSLVQCLLEMIDTVHVWHGQARASPRPHATAGTGVQHVLDAEFGVMLDDQCVGSAMMDQKRKRCLDRCHLAVQMLIGLSCCPRVHLVVVRSDYAGTGGERVDLISGL